MRHAMPLLAANKHFTVNAYSLWPMAYGLWPTAYGLWVMAYSLWPMAYGLGIRPYGAPYLSLPMTCSKLGRVEGS